MAPARFEKIVRFQDLPKDRPFLVWSKTAPYGASFAGGSVNVAGCGRGDRRCLWVLGCKTPFFLHPGLTEAAASDFTHWAELPVVEGEAA